MTWILTRMSCLRGRWHIASTYLSLYLLYDLAQGTFVFCSVFWDPGIPLLIKFDLWVPGCSINWRSHMEFGAPRFMSTLSQLYHKVLLHFQQTNIIIKSRSTASALLSAYAPWLQTHRQTPLTGHDSYWYVINHCSLRWQTDSFAGR